MSNETTDEKNYEIIIKNPTKDIEDLLWENNIEYIKKKLADKILQ